MRQLKITTPDQVVFRLTAAGLSTRAAAWLVDQIVVMAMRVGAFIGLAWAGHFALSLFIPIIIALDSLYFIFFEWRNNGQTIGKQCFKIRVATVSGARLSFQDILIRNVIRMVDSLPFLMLTGGAAAFWDPLGRRLGDLAAGTMVVREKAGAFTPPPADRDRPNSLNSPVKKVLFLSSSRPSHFSRSG